MLAEVEDAEVDGELGALMLVKFMLLLLLWVLPLFVELDALLCIVGLFR